MFGVTTGMTLSGRGLELTAQQVVSVGNEIFYLNDGLILSKRYDSLQDVGFSDTDTATRMVAEIDTQYAPYGSIVEIAGGDTLKVRYDTGMGYECSVLGSTILAIEKGEHNARVTKHGWYSPSNADLSGNTFIIDFYKSGAGDAPLVPYLSAGGDDDVISIFEGVDSDTFVRASDATSTEMQIGNVGGFAILTDGTTEFIRTPLGDTTIDGFGNIMRVTDEIKTIRLHAYTDLLVPTGIDYSNIFSPSHYEYIERNRVNTVPTWIGFGKTGHVVDAGNTEYMTVPIDNGVSTVGEPPTVPTQALNENIPFVEIAGVLYKVGGDGNLSESISVNTLNGNELIQHIYTTDMSTEVVLGSNTGGNDIEPFSVNGYCFGYGDNHYVDANFQTV